MATHPTTAVQQVHHNMVVALLATVRPDTEALATAQALHPMVPVLLQADTDQLTMAQAATAVTTTETVMAVIAVIAGTEQVTA